MQETTSLGTAIIFLGIFLLLLGFFITFIGEGKNNKADVRGGAVVFIGPIPIIFGSDKNSAALIAILSLLLIAAAYFFLRK